MRYQDLGPGHFRSRDKSRTAAKLAQRIRNLDVEITNAA